MNTSRILARLAGCWLAGAGWLLAAPASVAADASETLIVAGATVIAGDGTEPIKDAVVYIRDGAIERIEVAKNGSFPQGANVVSAQGKFLVPGLVEAHAHIDQVNGLGLTAEQAEIAREYNLRAFLYNGVTTVINMSSRDLAWVQGKQKAAIADAALPRILTGAEHFTVTGGWGGRHGGGVASPTEIHARVDKAAAAGVDLLKIIYEDGLGSEPAFPRLSSSLLNEIVGYGRQKNLPVFVHATDTREYTDAIEARPTALAHGLLSPLRKDDPIPRQLREREIYVVPTIVLFESFYRYVDTPQLLDDPIIKASVPDFVLNSLLQPAPLAKAMGQMDTILKMKAIDWGRRSLGQLKENTRKFADAGVLLAVGSDSGGAVPHAFQGHHTPREMEILAECCMSPMRTIVAATQNGARIVGREAQFGTLRPGRSADILILNGNPLDDMRHIRDFDRILVRGKLIERSSLTFSAFAKQRGSAE